MSEYISVTETAKIIREQLKKAFPKKDYPVLKFSVKCHQYSMGASIDITWIDGPSKKEVEALTNRFEGKKYNIEEDLAESRYDNWKGMKIRWGSDYINCCRNTSKQFLERLLQHFREQKNFSAQVEIFQNIGGNYSYRPASFKDEEACDELYKATDSININELNNTIGEILNFNSTLDFIKKINAGEVTAEEIKKVWQIFCASREAIELELTQLTKKELVKYTNSAYAHDYKKAELVKVVYESLAGRFLPVNSLGYNPMSETHLQAIARMIPTITDQQIQDRAKEISEYRSELLKAIKEPETLRDFERFISYRGTEKLSDEQLIKYEKLKAESTREYRARCQKRKLNVEETQIPDDLKLTIRKDYHTKDECDIWVVELSKRVERFVFDNLKNRAKSLGGYYSTYSKGFVFDVEENANNFVGLNSIDGEEQLEKKEAE
ncbi:MAG: LPD29 domain-containing protein, partial [Prochloraceae cyanobacterium]